MTEETPFLSLQQVVHRYPEKRTGQMVEALRVPSLSIERGEIVAVLGANGSGKSTLLELCAALLPPTEGAVAVAGDRLWQKGNTLQMRRKVPMLLQKTVLFSTSVLKNVLYGLRLRGITGTDARDRAEEALRAVDLAGLTQRRYNELSGGEQRRVALARVLALDAPGLILDEPTAGLDHDSEALVENLITRLGGTGGRTVLLSSHNKEQAARLADRSITLVEGRPAEEGIRL